MNSLGRKDVIGNRILDIIISAPDKPVSMGDMSTSKGFLRLDGGIVICLDESPPLHSADPRIVADCVRVRECEAEFADAIGKKIVDVLFDGSLTHVLIEDGLVISTAVSQFWIRPCLERDAASLVDAKSVW